jgi:hypothetical protein
MLHILTSDKSFQTNLPAWPSPLPQHLRLTTILVSLFPAIPARFFSAFSKKGSVMIYTRIFCTSHDLFFIFQDAKDQSVEQQCCLTTAMLVPQ